MKKILLSILMLCSTIFAMAQMMDPVKISSELKMLKGAEAEIIFSATIDAGWHLYSTDLGNDGPTSATLIVNKMDGAELVGKLKPVGKEIEKFFPMSQIYRLLFGAGVDFEIYEGKEIWFF